MPYGTNEKNGIVRRFSVGRVLEHWVAVSAFTVLAATGLSQKFYALGISQWFILNSGGIDGIRLIHRYAGIAFTAIIIAHICTAFIGVTLRKWQPSMMINKKDFTDTIHNIKYYIGAEDHPARCDRYDYKQKFEYWGVLISGLLMVFTGFVLWFAASVTRLLPGEVIPVTKALHTNQAFLVFLIVALWHIYNAILSPEVFPLDTVMFTGRISEERMKLEHPLEYENKFVPQADIIEKAGETKNGTVEDE